MDDDIHSFSVSGLFFDTVGSGTVDDRGKVGQEFFSALFFQEPPLGFRVIEIPDIFLRLYEAFHDEGNVQFSIFDKSRLSIQGIGSHLRREPALTYIVSVEAHLKYTVRNRNSIGAVDDETVHHEILLSSVVREIFDGFSAQEDISQLLIQLFVFPELSHQRVKQGVFFCNDQFDGFVHAVLCPGLRKRGQDSRDDPGVNQLADAADQEGVAVCVCADDFCDLRGIHSCVMVCIVFVQHPADARPGQAHIDVKIGRDVPGTVLFVIVLLTDPASEMADVGDTCQNDRLKRGRIICVAADVAVAKLGKEVQENLIVGGAVHFIDDQDQRNGSPFHPSFQNSEEVVHLDLFHI